MQKRTVISSLFWKLAEKGSAQVLQLTVTVLLARLLSPADYGLLAVTSVFVAVMNVFAEAGLSTAVIQRKNIDDTDLNSVFLLNVSASLALYALAFAFAPRIAAFFSLAQLAPVLRVYALTAVISSFMSVQGALIYRHMRFKLYFKKTLLSLSVSGAAGVAAAYFGLGVWALVIQQAAHRLVLCVLLWRTAQWRPRLAVSFTRLRALFAFGFHVLVNNLLETLYNQLRSFVIGARYAPEDLAFYQKGEQVPAVVATSTDFALQGVMLPAYSREQDDRDAVKKMLRRTAGTGCYLLLPVMALLAGCARPLVLALLGEKWLSCAPYLQLMCVVYAFQPLRTSGMQALYGTGKSRLVLALNLITKAAGVALLLAAARIGVPAIAAGAVLTSLFATAVSMAANARCFSYTLLEQARDLRAPLLLSGPVLGFAFALGRLPLPALPVLLIQAAAGAAAYWALSALFKVESYRYLASVAGTYLKNNRTDGGHAQ